MKKIKIKLAGERRNPSNLREENKNTFDLLGMAKRALIKEGKEDEAKDLLQKALNSSGPTEILKLIHEYCEIEGEERKDDN